jgi:hypothetical protein
MPTRRHGDGRDCIPTIVRIKGWRLSIALPASRSSVVGPKTCLQALPKLTFHAGSRAHGALWQQLHWGLARRLDRVFDILNGRELDVPELAVHLFDPAHIDVADHIARFRIDGHRPARAFPGHSLHCGNEAVAVRLAARFSDGFIDNVHAVIA